MPNVMIGSADAVQTRGAKLPPVVWQLVDAIHTEAQLVSDLITLLWRQRDAVAADQLATVEDTTFGIQRVLHTLNEARRLRSALTAHLGLVESGSLADGFSALEPLAAQMLRDENERLTDLACVLTREVAINRSILHDELAECDPHQVVPSGHHCRRSHRASR